MSDRFAKKETELCEWVNPSWHTFYPLDTELFSKIIQLLIRGVENNIAPLHFSVASI